MNAARFRAVAETELYIYVDRVADDVSGRVYNFANEEKQYSSLTDLLFKSEHFFNAQGCPQPYYSARDFARPKKSANNIQKREAFRMTQNEMNEEHKVSADFVIRVSCRQNATWQGEITWVVEDKSKHFSSGLEMIRLLDQAVQKSSGQKEESGWE